MTERELIDGVKQGDKQAIRTMVEGYHKQIIKTSCHLLQNMDDAEDIAQDVFVEILESVAQFRGNSSLSTWVYRLTVNKSLNLIRKNKRKQVFRHVMSFFQHKDGGDKALVAEPTVESNPYDDGERRKLLNNAVDSLPKNQKTAFVLSKYEELPYKAISEIMGLSLPSVESLLQRAKHNLQKKLIVQFPEYSNKK